MRLMLMPDIVGTGFELRALRDDGKIENGNSILIAWAENKRAGTKLKAEFASKILSGSYDPFAEQHAIDVATGKVWDNLISICETDPERAALILSKTRLMLEVAEEFGLAVIEMESPDYTPLDQQGWPNITSLEDD